MVMGMREKLIELLETVVSPKEILCYGEVLVSTSRVADHLIANDVVPVVRCKDCTQYNGHRYCRYTELIVLDNDFCSYGERKGNES